MRDLAAPLVCFATPRYGASIFPQALESFVGTCLATTVFATIFQLDRIRRCI